MAHFIIISCVAFPISTCVLYPRPELQDLVTKLKDIGATLVITEDDIASTITKEKVKALNGPPIRLALNCVGGTNATNMARLLGYV